MTQIELASGVLTDFDRFVDRLASFEISNASERISEIIQAIQILALSPLIGRKVKDGKRELVVGRESHGCVMADRLFPQIDAGFVLALRSQRELGFPAGR